jgi:hypothetical protein
LFRADPGRAIVGERAMDPLPRLLRISSSELFSGLPASTALRFAARGITMPSVGGLWLLALVLLFGCASKYSGPPSHAEAASPGYYDEAGGMGGGGDDYFFEDDALEGEMTAAESNISSRARAKKGATFGIRREFAAETKKAPPAPPAESAPEPEPEPDIEVEVEQPREVPKQAATKRQIIYTATMQVSVYDVEHSIAIAESLPDRFGGWLHQRQDNQLVLRIPAEHLEEAMDAIAELGVVDSRTLEALDVTAEYTDLESRIRVLTQMHAQLTLLLEKAKTVEQALEIRKALDEITMELEIARARMRELAKSIAFSTLIIRIVARGPAHDLPSSNDPFPWVVELGVEATEYR